MCNNCSSVTYQQAPPPVFMGSTSRAQGQTGQTQVVVFVNVAIPGGGAYGPPQYPTPGQTAYPSPCAQQPYPTPGQTAYPSPCAQQPYPMPGQTAYPSPCAQQPYPMPGQTAYPSPCAQQPYPMPGQTAYPSPCGNPYWPQAPQQQQTQGNQRQTMIQMFMAFLMGFIAGKKSVESQEPEESQESQKSEDIDISVTKCDEDMRGEWGDPHYNLIGENGEEINFDHKGKNDHTYNIFEGDGIKIDGKYVEAQDKNNPQVVGVANVNIGKDNLRFDKEGNASINGKKLEKGSSTTLDDGTKIIFDDNGQIIIKTADGNSKIHLRAEDNGITIDPSGEFTNAGGIIGTAIKEGRVLSNEECEEFDVTKERGIK